MRITGWMGRADQRTKVKGMFVDPRQVDAIVKKHSEITRARLIVSRDASNDVLSFVYEGSALSEDSLAESIQQILKLKATIKHSVNELPNDGLVIADEGIITMVNRPSTLSLLTVAMPADTNANGDIFGGWVIVTNGFGQRDVCLSYS